MIDIVMLLQKAINNGGFNHSNVYVFDKSLKRLSYTLFFYLLVTKIRQQITSRHFSHFQSTEHNWYCR